MARQVPTTYADEAAHRRAIASLANENAINRELLREWNAQAQVPTNPRRGEWGWATYGPSGGNGVYYYDGAVWRKLADAVDGSFPA